MIFYNISNDWHSAVSTLIYDGFTSTVAVIIIIGWSDHYEGECWLMVGLMMVVLPIYGLFGCNGEGGVVDSVILACHCPVYLLWPDIEFIFCNATYSWIYIMSGEHCILHLPLAITFKWTYLFEVDGFAKDTEEHEPAIVSTTDLQRHLLHRSKPAPRRFHRKRRRLLPLRKSPSSWCSAHKQTALKRNRNRVETASKQHPTYTAIYTL